eukprot:8167120-Pyramimonas_sp.AAC.1
MTVGCDPQAGLFHHFLGQEPEAAGDPATDAECKESLRPALVVEGLALITVEIAARPPLRHERGPRFLVKQRCNQAFAHA